MYGYFTSLLSELGQDDPPSVTTRCVCPKGSCLFPAGLPNDTVDGKKSWTFSTRQIAFGGGVVDAGTATPNSASVCRRYRYEPWTGLDTNTH